MKKKIGDLTLKDIKKFCNKYSYQDSDGYWCRNNCPLCGRNICCTKLGEVVDNEDLNQEVEVEE